MDSGNSAEEPLQLAREYVQRLGDTVEEEFEGRVGDASLEGVSCRHGTHTYLVMASEAWEWLQLRYPLNLDQLYAIRRLETEDTEDDIQLTDSKIRQARRELDDRLDDMPAVERREFRMNLIQMLSRGSVILSLDTTSPLNVHGFNLDTRVFISESSFGLGDFHSNLQTIINLGWVGEEFTLENYGFRPPEVGEGGGAGPNI